LVDSAHTHEKSSPATDKLRVSVVYGIMLTAAVGVFLLVQSYGETRGAPPPAEALAAEKAAGTNAQADTLFHVLLALAAVVVTGRVMGKLFGYIGQPPVIGEVVGGIFLGPSLLGWFAPGVSAYLLPASVAPFLAVIAQLGVILYMFLVGVELNAGLLRQRAHATVAISHASIVVPFVLGTLLALGLYPRLSTSDVPFTSFALFLGVAMSITAFPVLARILSDRRMQRTPLGVVALACAATDDVTAWCLLAFVVGVAQAKVGGAIWVIALTLAYVAFNFWVLRPIATRLLARLDDARVSQGIVAIILVLVLLSALVTEFIGVHAIFGAFLFGAVIPHDSAIARAVKRKLEDLVTVLLLPAFFAFTGMQTRIGLVSGVENWLICGIIILVAIAGKFGGTYLAARLTGHAWRESSALGVLMNTRGLMQLIVLGVGLDLRVISPTLFAMMIVMALVTTMGTAPMLQVLVPMSSAEKDIRKEPAEPGEFAKVGCD
jgi:Kef-type K+ transport system membrane component KefB